MCKKKKYLWIHYSIIKMCNKKLKWSLYKNFWLLYFSRFWLFLFQKKEIIHSNKELCWWDHEQWKKEWNLLEKKKRVGELRIKEYGHSDAGILSCCLFNGVLSLEDERLPEAHTWWESLCQGSQSHASVCRFFFPLLSQASILNYAETTVLQDWIKPLFLHPSFLDWKS